MMGGCPQEFGSFCYRGTSVRTGPCALTSLWEDDCENGTKGSWWTSDARGCVLRCAACTNCKFLSFSARANDCSWYAECASVVTPSSELFSSFATLEFAGFDPDEIARERALHTGVCSGRMASEAERSERVLRPPRSSARMAGEQGAGAKVHLWFQFHLATG